MPKSKKWRPPWAWLVGLLQALGSAAGAAGSAVGGAAGSVGSALGSAAGSVGSALGSAGSALGSAGSAIGHGLGQAARTAGGAISNVAKFGGLSGMGGGGGGGGGTGVLGPASLPRGSGGAASTAWGGPKSPTEKLGLSSLGIGGKTQPYPVTQGGYAPAPVSSPGIPATQVTPRQISTPPPSGLQYEGMSQKQFDTALESRGYPVSRGMNWQRLMARAMDTSRGGGGGMQGQVAPGVAGQQVQSPQMPLSSAVPFARQAAAGGALPWWYLMSRAR